MTFFFAEANRNDNNIVFKLDPTRGGGFAQHLYTVNALIQDVTTIGVCSLVCTEPEKSLLINAWLYDSSTRVCSCIVIDKKLCRDEIGTEASILEMEQNINSSSVWLFVNMTKADVKTHCKGNYFKHLSCGAVFKYKDYLPRNHRADNWPPSPFEQ